MNLGDIITRVKRQFGDDVQAQITDDDIVRWVNDACLEIVTSNYTNQGVLKGETEIIAGKADYVLPPDLYLLRAVRANGIKLGHSTLDQITELDGYSEETTGTPVSYYVYNELLYLYPKPAESLGTIDIYYVKTPDVMVKGMNTVEPDVPKQYHPRIVEYCIAQAAELDDNIAHYQLKLGQFRENLQSLKQNGEQPEGDDYYPFITYTSEYVMDEVW